MSDEVVVSELPLAELDFELMDIVGEPEAVWRMVLRLPMLLRMRPLSTDWVFGVLEVPTVVVSLVTVARNDEASEPALSVMLLRAPSTRVEASAMPEEAILPIESVFWAWVTAVIIEVRATTESFMATVFVWEPRSRGVWL